MHQFEQWSEAEIEEANSHLEELRGFRNQLATTVAGTAEFFEPNPKVDVESRKNIIRKLKYFNQTSVLQSLLLKHELSLKLTIALDGYLLAVENQSPILPYLSARYVLELLATVTSLAGDLEAAKCINVRDWQGRSRTFLSVIIRARHGASDPKIADFLKSIGVSSTSIKPFNITESIKKLSDEEAFSDAEAEYHYLSNMCHHNGSTHQLLHASMRETTSIVTPFGSTVLTTIPSTAVTLTYPADRMARSALIYSAGLVLKWAKAVKDKTAAMPDVPFTESDCAALTNGQLANWANALMPQPLTPNPRAIVPFSLKTGRNAPCPCGSGKKFKNCCLAA